MCNPPDTWDVDIEDELTFEQLKNLIKQANEWGIKDVIFSGGEPLVRAKDVIKLIRYAHSLGQSTTVATNGVISKDIVKELFKAGLNSYTVSIDGAKAETNDSIRGVKGAFEKSITSLKEFARLKKDNKNHPIALNTATVVMKDNFQELVDMYKMLKEIGVNNVMFQAISNEYPSLIPKGNELKELEKITKKLVELKQKDGIISNDTSYFNLMIQYFKDIADNKEPEKPLSCLAGYKNIIIKSDGTLDICGYGPFRVSAKRMTLKEIWFSKEYKKSRKKIKSCRRNCLFLCYNDYYKINWRNLFRSK